VVIDEFNSVSKIVYVLNVQEDNRVAYRAAIMAACCQHCRQRKCVGCLTGCLGCRCHGYEQSSGNTTLVCKSAILVIII